MEFLQKSIIGLVLIVFLTLSTKLHIPTTQSSTDPKSDDLIFKEDGQEPRIKRFLQYYASGSKINDTFQKGDTLFRALDRHEVDANLVREIARLSLSVIDLGKIKAGTPFEIIFNDQREMTEFRIRISWDKKLVIKKDSSGRWAAGVQPVQMTTEKHRSAGTIRNCLWNAATEQNVAPATIMDFADLFSWQIDFATDFKTGDAFILYYDNHVLPDGSRIPGAIHAAKVINDGKAFYAFRFEYEDGKSDYYDYHGNAVRCMFLKSPLRYRYVSSHFSYRRFHPILKIFRPHLGVDYAAPTGTPVSALGDGVVVFRGVRGGYGNYIEVSHRNDYVTCYGHLSRFANGIKKGSHVSQGQVIGYVGATGTATGPHLDFRVRVKGKYLNPLTLKTTSSGPLPDSCRPAFIKHRDRLVATLEADARQ